MCMIDQIIEFNIMSPLLGDGYKAGGNWGNQDSSACAEGYCGSWVYHRFRNRSIGGNTITKTNTNYEVPL